MEGQMQPMSEGPSFERVWTLIEKSSQEFDLKMRELREQTAETDRALREQIAETDHQLKETDRILREQIAETDRVLREQIAETDRVMKEQSAETDRKMRETDRRIGGLGNRIGELIEHLAASNILEKFSDLSFTFNRIARNLVLRGDNKEYLAEVDILLENGDYAMAVEVKSLCTLPDVKDHLKRMAILRREADRHNDRRKYVGSVAAALYKNEAKEYALKSGLYVVEQAGDTVRIRKPEKTAVW